MFGSQILDVAIGMVFVYLLLSIVCTAANEIIAGLFALRARNLAKGISNLLADNRVKGLDQLFYSHPLIKGLYRGNRKPSYIPGHTFALAFLDGIAPFDGKAERAVAQVRTAVDALACDSGMKRLLSIFLQQAGGDFNKLQSAVETWFDDSMSRVIGWYKRQSQVITVILAVAIAGACNADTIAIAKKLYTDPTLRAAIVSQAQTYAAQQPPDSGGDSGNTQTAPSPASPGGKAAAPPAADPKETFQKTLAALNQLGLPLGWETAPQKSEWVLKIIGLLLTVLAVSLGTPFWFDTLGRIVKIRSTGTALEVKKQNEKKPS